MPSYPRRRVDEVSNSLPGTIPWDFMIDAEWFEKEGKTKYAEETKGWMERGNPAGYPIESTQNESVN